MVQGQGVRYTDRVLFRTIKALLFCGAILLGLASCNLERDKTGEPEQDAKTPLTETPTEEKRDTDYDPAAKISKLGIELISPSAPAANYVHAVRTGNLIFLAGKGPKKADGENITGKLGDDLSIDQGYEAAR
ncbi:MAG: RidA family protein, partial [Pricia sp.]